MQKAERRKVLFTNGMTSDKFLIITDAPKEAIEQWCYNYNQELENGQNSFLEPLKTQYYVLLLHDSEMENDNENIYIIGYDESYDLNDYYN
jgi:hypothetical protein